MSIILTPMGLVCGDFAPNLFKDWTECYYMLGFITISIFMIFNHYKGCVL